MTLGLSNLSYSRICTDKPAHFRIIVPCLQIVQSRFSVVHIPAVTEWAHLSKGIRHAACGAYRIAPCVIGVLGYDISRRVNYAGNIALCIFYVVILCSIIVYGHRTQTVIPEMQGIPAACHMHKRCADVVILSYCAVDRFLYSSAVCIIGIGYICRTISCGCKLPPVLPCIAPCTIVCYISYGIAGYCLPVIACKQIFPRGICVAIRDCFGRCTKCTLCIRILFLFEDISAVVIRIRPRLICCLIVFSCKLVNAVVFIRCGICAVTYGGYVAAAVVGIRLLSGQTHRR
jgi:hypothetical protein